VRRLGGQHTEADRLSMGELEETIVMVSPHPEDLRAEASTG